MNRHPNRHEPFDSPRPPKTTLSFVPLLLFCIIPLAMALLAIVLLADDAGADETGHEPVTICHKPGTPAEHTLTVDDDAVPAHLQHGDTMGACAPVTPEPEDPATDPVPEPPVVDPVPPVDPPAECDVYCQEHNSQPPLEEEPYLVCGRPDHNPSTPHHCVPVTLHPDDGADTVRQPKQPSHPKQPVVNDIELPTMVNAGL